MNISFDVLPLISDNMSGIGYCQAGLVGEMVKSHPEDRYLYEYFSRKDHEVKRNRLKAYMHENCDINESHFSGFLYRCIMNMIPVPYSLFFGKKSELTHFFNYIIPPFVHGKKVVTIHDMVVKAYPETVRFRTKHLLNTGMKKSMKRADVIITDSEFSKSEIEKYFPQYSHKVQVVYCGVNSDKFYPVEDKSVVEKVKRSLDIEGEYFLYLGTIEPRKNLERLIEAYSLLLKKDENVPRLVMAGGKGWLNSNIYQKVVELKLEKYVQFTKYIPDEDLCPLINGATAFVFPSIYEGFGMPPLEAMACGVPVVCSKEASLPEVVGDCAVMTDAYDPQSIADGMYRIYSDKALAEELRVRGLQRAKEFTWHRFSEKLHGIYEAVLK
ncbi:MAG: glycosyltransferase family 4 protein [Oscillospiraceae bacterium]|nr:glycosyltransferase family 4 protein [Oscillospiraceae bacterium]MBQ9982720.1 glycosyltransferase family 4 protein [Oscillospiraceae bacterium]